MNQAGVTWRSNVEVVGSNPIKGLRCYLEQEMLPLLLSTGWFQERVRAWFQNQNKLRALWKIYLNIKYAPSLNIVRKTKK